MHLLVTTIYIILCHVKKTFLLLKQDRVDIGEDVTKALPHYLCKSFYSN